MASLSSGFDRPTLATLIDRISSDLNARLPGRDARIRRSVLWVLARVLAGAVHLLYGFAVWASNQTLPDTADGDRLLRHAAIWGLSKTAAAAAVGDVTFTGTPATAIPIGSTLQRADGLTYETTAALVIGGGGSVDGQVQATATGADGDCDGGVVLSFVTPISGVDSSATVKASPDNVTGGADLESDDSLRARLVERIGNPPQGGAVADYEQWAQEIATVDRVFVSALELGAGTVVVRFTVEGTGAAIIPGAAKVAEVQTYIDERRPVTAAVTVAAPTGKAINLTIHVVPDTADVRAAVEASIEDLFAAEGACGGTIPNSRLREAISAATGEKSHTLTAVDGGAGTADVVTTSTQVPYLGTVTWI